MQNTTMGLQRFFEACNEMIEGKFILADRKIGELLKAIASDEELTGLFEAVTRGFDYHRAKTAYLKFPSEAHGAHGVALLPAERQEILAFVFCLLVEFDSGKVKFSDFLLRYFYEDGSYTASYTLFVGKLIRPFRDIVRDCFPALAEKEKKRVENNKEDGIYKKMVEKISIERMKLSMLTMTKEDAMAGEMMLTELHAAIRKKDADEIKALLCGYLYFLSAVNASDDNSNQIFQLAAEL